jgi:hypothetical protein
MEPVYSFRNADDFPNIKARKQMRGNNRIECTYEIIYMCEKNADKFTTWFGS